MSYLIDDLVAKVKVNTASPDGQPAFEDTNLVDMFNEEMANTILPFIVSLQQEYLAAYSDQSITSETEYEIPAEAFGSALTEVKLINGNNIVDLKQISSDDYQYYNDGFYIKANKIVIINPGNYNNYTLRMFYVKRPNILTLSTNCRQIVSILGAVATVSNASVFATGDYLDIVKQNPHFDTLISNDQVTIAGANITFDGLTGVSVGDWIADTGYSPIAQIPQDMQHMLFQAVCIRVFEALGEVDAGAAMQGRLDRTRMSIAKIMSNRIVNEPKKSLQINSFFD